MFDSMYSIAFNVLIKIFKGLSTLQSNISDIRKCHQVIQFVIMDEYPFSGHNSIYSLRYLKIILRSESIEYVLERKGPEKLAENAPEKDIWEYKKWKDDSIKIKCYMLASMKNELQRQHEDMHPRAMLLHLKKLFAEKSRTHRYEISKNLFRARMAESSSVHAHILKKIYWIEKLTVLGV